MGRFPEDESAIQPRDLKRIKEDRKAELKG